MHNFQNIYYELAYLINKKLYELKKIPYSVYKNAENNIIFKMGK